MRLGLAGLALAVAAVVALALPPSVAYPPVCSWATNVGDFCIDYDPVLGRYQTPPAGVPADFAHFATETAPTSLPSIEVRLGASALAFVVALLLGSALVRVARSGNRRLRSRDIP